MSYPFVASAVQGGTARGPRLAVVWHMAEGGGTVGYLSRQNPNGVSVHFVVEYTGRIVQMLRLDQMHTSIRSTDIRTTDDADGLYGATVARAVMHEWADIRRTLGPNHASIGVEVEGFAKDGPNAKQRTAIGALWADLQGRYPGIRSLGHRDFADYKACPGKKFPWAAVGGHGPATEDDMIAHTAPDQEVGGTVTLKADALAYPLKGEPGERLPVPGGITRPAIGIFTLTALDDRPCYLMLVGPRLAFIAADAVTFTPSDKDCATEVEAAIAADRAKAHIVYT